MRSEKSVLAAAYLLVLLAAAAIIGLVACVQSGAPVGQPLAPPGDEVQTEPLPNEIAQSSDWLTYRGNGVNFAYPKDWPVAVEQNESPENGLPTRHVRLQNTDKQVALGGAAPDDYYVEQNGGRVFNAAKYADRYIVITVDVYEGRANQTWADFLNAAYSGVVVEHENYSVAVKPELDAVAAKRIAGVYSGRPRFFVKQGDRIYDLALFYQGVDQEEAWKYFNAFIQNFTF